MPQEPIPPAESPFALHAQGAAAHHSRDSLPQLLTRFSSDYNSAVHIKTALVLEAPDTRETETKDFEQEFEIEVGITHLAPLATPKALPSITSSALAPASELPHQNPCTSRCPKLADADLTHFCCARISPYPLHTLRSRTQSPLLSGIELATPNSSRTVKETVTMVEQTPLTVPSGGITGTTEMVNVPATTTLPIRENEGAKNGQNLSAEERLALIKENLAEFLDPEIIETIVKEGRNPKIYWGE